MNETVAEVLANLWGSDPNDEAVWERAMAESVNFYIDDEGNLVERGNFS